MLYRLDLEKNVIGTEFTLPQSTTQNRAYPKKSMFRNGLCRSAGFGRFLSAVPRPSAATTPLRLASLSQPLRSQIASSMVKPQLSQYLQNKPLLQAQIDQSYLLKLQTLDAFFSPSFPTAQRKPIEPIVEVESTTEGEDKTVHLDSVLRKRRLKMKKHKLRKRRKRQRSLKIRLGKI